MATRKKSEPEKEAEGGEILHKTAKVIGAVLGTIAAKTGIAHTDAPPKKKSGKLVKKMKHRLPRKEKKEEKKRALKLAS